jgi:hypothetical protein
MKNSYLIAGPIFLAICLFAIPGYAIRDSIKSSTERALAHRVENVFKEHEKQYFDSLRRYFPRYNHLSDNIITYKGFCYPACLVLGALLQEHGLEKLNLAIVDKGDGGHTFLTTRAANDGKEVEFIIDPTYRQFLIPLSENELEHDFGKMPVILVAERSNLSKQLNGLIREFIGLGNTIKTTAPAARDMDDFMEFWEPAFVVGSEITRNSRRTSFEKTIGQYSNLSLLLNIQVNRDTIMDNFAATIPYYLDNTGNFWFYHDCLLVNPPFVNYKPVADRNMGGIAYLKKSAGKKDVFEIMGLFPMKTEEILFSQLIALNRYYNDICLNWKELGLFRDFPHVIGQALRQYLTDNGGAPARREKKAGLVIGYEGRGVTKGIDYLDIQKYINKTTIYDSSFTYPRSAKFH